MLSSGIEEASLRVSKRLQDKLRERWLSFNQQQNIPQQLNQAPSALEISFRMWPATLSY